jgi:trimethylamine:corrinoid methyltransferase-like protein
MAGRLQSGGGSLNMFTESELRDIYQNATDEARALLENHEPESLSEEKQKALRAIVEETEDALGLGRSKPEF